MSKLLSRNHRRYSLRLGGDFFPSLSMRRVAVLLTGVLLLSSPQMPAGNPIITTSYTADPSARVFNGKLYLYASHDRDDAQAWDMTDWHVFSSEDLVHWTDHGVALDLKQVPFAKKYAWAPDCAFRNGKYYFYFPVSQENRCNTDRVGVAVGDNPEGPFTCHPKPLISGYPEAFDPCVFVDDDGSAYLVAGQKRLGVGKLKESMLELDGPLRAVQGASGFFEGAWMHKYRGKYYLSYSTGRDISYAMGDSPFGPFVRKGVILKGVPHAASTTHHSIVEFKGQWYLFYHSAALADDHKAPNRNYKRSVCIDRLSYNPDGTIVPVVPTLSGVGAVK